VALSDANNAIQLDSTSCTIMGGNSGSPLIWNAGTSGSPSYRITGVVHGFGVQPAAVRFRYAPRYAAGVALASYDDGSARTQVFATDRDYAGRDLWKLRADDPGNLVWYLLAFPF